MEPSNNKLEDWQKATNKDQESFYENEEFREDYTTEMSRKATACCRLIQSEVGDLIKSWLPGQMRMATAPTLRILSVGCGPGTDLLAAVWAFAELSDGRPLALNCTGVDKQPWDMGQFELEFNKTLQVSDAAFSASWIVYQADCEAFVRYCIESKQKFDLVISCYAKAVDKMQLLGEAVPQILSGHGRIFVIDNYSPDLKRGLKSYGFYVSQPNQDMRPIFLVKKKL